MQRQTYKLLKIVEAKKEECITQNILDTIVINQKSLRSVESEIKLNWQYNVLCRV